MESEPTDFETPYSALAEIYDYVMRHVDYVHWADYVESLLVRHNVVAQTILDIACGTGSLAIELRKRGYRTGGADGCGPMLKRAKVKAADAGYDIPFSHQAFLELEGFKPYDTAVCLYDSMNYLMSLDDFASCAGPHPRRPFTPEVSLSSTSVPRRIRFATSAIFERCEQGDGFSYTRHSYYKDGIQYNDFEIMFKKPEADRERTSPTAHLRRFRISNPMIEASPFRLEGRLRRVSVSVPPTQPYGSSPLRVDELDVVELQHVWVERDGRALLQDVDFEMERGENSFT